jgi:hypothetical protein
MGDMEREVKRYTIGGIANCTPPGFHQYVAAEDYDRLRAERDALREAAGKVICYECGATGKIHQGGVPGEWLPCPDCADLRALLNPEAPR